MNPHITHRRPRSLGAVTGPRPASVVALLLGLVLLAAACGKASETKTADPAADADWAGVALTKPSERPQFTLTDTDGKTFDFYEETEGKLTYLFFGYTNCPDVCPVHMAQISEVLARPGMPDAKVVFVTTDPTRDTPEALRKFLDNFDESFIGLTGADEELVAAQEAAGVPPAKLETPDGKPDPEGGYTVAHAGLVLAFAPDNLGYTVYPFGSRTSQYATDMPKLAEIEAVTGGDRPTTTVKPTTADGPQWGGVTKGELSISDARAAEPAGPNGALYFTIENGGPADTLVSASTESAPAVEFHRTTADGDTTSMSPIPDGINVPADGSVALEPGGLHAMLMKVKPIEAGDMMPVTLTFEVAGDVDVLVPVVPTAEAAG
ncbi:MAG: SCO family protein [Microthrixaceae bacterium]